MAGNTFGRVFTVTSFGESHGPALGCVVDGCPPGLASERGRSAGGCGPPPLRHLAVHQPTARARHGAHSLRRVRGQDHGHADRTPGRERGSALARLREDQGPLPARTCRLHLPAEIRISRLSRRRPFLGARDGDARRGRRDCAQVSARALGRDAFTAIWRRWVRWCSSRKSRRAPTRIHSSVRIRAASKSSRISIWRLREAGDSIGARVTVIAEGVPPGSRRAGVRTSRCGSGERHDGHQRGQGRGDRRRLQVPSSSAAPSIATSSLRRASRAITPAACSAASPRARRSW